MSDARGWDAIVLGAGAAGLFYAACAGQRGKRVLLLERADRPGKKILISGGGRCNFTNLGVAPSCFISENARFVRSALARYDQHDFLALIDAHRIDWHEKTLGQLFCDGSAKQIVRMLLDECAKATRQGGEVQLTCDADVGAVSHVDGQFIVEVSTQGQTVRHCAQELICATGGPSIPKMGATGYAYDLARQFDVPLITPRPALVPMLLDAEREGFGADITDLAGVAAPVRAKCGGPAFSEALLFTHRGLSGPAVLQASSYWNAGAALTVDFLGNQPAALLTALKARRPTMTLAGALREALPARLAQRIAGVLISAENAARTARSDGDAGESNEQVLQAFPDKALRAMEERLRAWRFHPTGTEGYAKAEVTAGGIDTKALSSKTMACKAVPGLYFIGEAVDVTGWLGGYNFQWAWSSAAAAAGGWPTYRSGATD
ncbi:MAG: aminoacetone oxidase family FAD-binding enzyme [Pseudomonadota bacterium]